MITPIDSAERIDLLHSFFFRNVKYLHFSRIWGVVLKRHQKPGVRDFFQMSPTVQSLTNFINMIGIISKSVSNVLYSWRTWAPSKLKSSWFLRTSTTLIMFFSYLCKMQVVVLELCDLESKILGFMKVFSKRIKFQKDHISMIRLKCLVFGI